MPCYTLIKVEVKDKEMAERALEELGLEATITKTVGKKTFTVTPKNQSYDFEEKFMQEYSVQVATKKAKNEGWIVTRNWNEETHETELTLRQYAGQGGGSFGEKNW